MSVAQQQKGTVISRPDLTILDTRELEWESVKEWAHLPALKGAVRKVLERDEDGEPIITISCSPPGFTLPELPYRHYHSTVYEIGYKLFGELPHWEYKNAEQQQGTMTKGEMGYFMYRWPGSIHGLEPGPVNLTGTIGIGWLTGKGTLIGSPEFKQETVHVPFAEDWKPNPDPKEPSVSKDGRGILINWPDLLKLDTLSMDWEAMPGLQGAYRKVLVRDEQGEPKIEITYLPAGFTLPDLPYRHYHKTVHEFGYVLGGELPHCEYESADQQKGELIVFKEGYFMHRRPGSIHGLEPGPTSPTGVIMLGWRTGSGTWIGEKHFDTETIPVPYA